MKKITILVIILICTTQWVNAQTSSANESLLVKRTVITGNFSKEIQNIKIIGRDFSKYYEFLETRSPDRVIDTSVNTTDGKFNFEIKIDHPVSLILNGFNLYYNVMDKINFAKGILIEPGDSINIDASAGDIYKDIKFSGRGAEKHHCIQAILEDLKNIRGPQLNITTDLLDKISSMDTIINIISKNTVQFRLSPVAKSIIEADYVTTLAGNLTDHILDSEVDIHDSKIKELFRQRNDIMDKLIQPLDSNLKYTSEFAMSLLKRGLMQYAMDNNLPYPYSEYWHGFRRDKAEKIRLTREFKMVQYDALDSLMHDTPIKEKALSNFIYRAISTTFGFTPETEAAAKKFIDKTESNSSFHNGIKALYDKYKGRLATGANAYSFALPDTSGKIVKLSDFKGKVIVLDFMFTGCGGCATMVPYLTKVEHSFKDNSNVIFIAISVSKDLKQVKKANGKYCTKESLLLYTDGKGYDHPMIWFYMPKYPTLVVIDQKGRIVTAGAPKPTYDNGVGLTAIIKETLKNN